MAAHSDKPSPLEDIALEEAFAQARAQDPVPSAELMERILAQSAKVQAGFADKAVPEGGLGQGVGWFWTLIGGWGGASALTASVCVGLFFGVAAPDTVMAYVPGIEVGTADAGFLDIFSDTAFEGEE